MEEGSVLVVFSGKAPKKSADAAYPYTPNRNFHYLTGVAEEGTALVLKRTAAQGFEEMLLIKKRDPLMVKWVGETITPEEATAVSGIQDIRTMDTLETLLHQCIAKEGIHVFHLDLERDGYRAGDHPGIDFAKELKDRYPQVTVKDLYPALSLQRQKKAPEEVALMEEAIDITREGIEALLRSAKPGMMEYELEAHFDYVLKKRGVREHAFDTICASGIRATVLHYVVNNAKTAEGDLVLLDLGATKGFYSADISRTFPISGRFTERQKQFYNLVLQAQEAVLEALKPGMAFKEINDIVHGVYARELQAMGLITQPEEVRSYYYHNTAHHLGLDTHDVGPREGVLEEGMVITVEPGIYVAEEGIGIRIEDDVLITAEGARNLSAGILKTVDEIEAFMAQAGR